MSTKVLLTGVTGFVGSHTTIQLLEKGYEVFGTLQNKDRANSIREIIGKYTTNLSNLTIIEADLTDRDIWLKLTKNMDYVQHIASPFPRELPKNENDLINPAKDGTLNILKAASENKVKRVVITSSVAAIVYGKTKNEQGKVFDENDWTDERNKKDSTPYFRSKTIAEKAAWEFLDKDHSGLELTTVLPGAILGPVLENDFGTSANMVIKILDGSSPALPKIGFDVVDVRSIADLLIRAMEMPNAANNRYIASSGYLTFKEVAIILKQKYPNKKIPTIELPNFLVRLFSNFDASLKPILLDLGIKRKIEISKAAKELQWKPLPTEEAVISCAKSIFETGILK
ncbi:MAG: SDR family oxidoreductase [Lutibacter sp.]